jgi:hypothetical protein
MYLQYRVLYLIMTRPKFAVHQNDGLRILSIVPDPICDPDPAPKVDRICH